MKRFLVVAAAICFAVGVKAADANNVSLNMSVSQEVTAGDAFDVKLTIIKQNLQGFARFHQDLPKGFVAEEISDSNEGAVFSFADQRLRFIWSSLPNTPEITIMYRIRITDPRIKGKLQLAGRFTYVLNDERQTADVESPIITVNTGSSITAEQAIDIDQYQNLEDVPSQPAAASTPTTQPTTATAGEVQQATTSNNEESSVFAVRQTPYMVNGEYYVNIQITKGALTGFGKIEEELLMQTSGNPIAIETKGALFNIEGTKLSYTWVNMPEENDFVISYKITPWQASTPVSIKGTFSYNNGETLESVDITERDVDFSSRVPVPPIEAAEAEVNEPAVAETPQPKAPEQSIEKRTQAMQRGLVFKVQVLATKQPLDDIDAYFEKYDITEPIVEEIHGFDPIQYAYKYVIGPFRKYEQAAQYRDLMWRKGITDAFVTCYYNGDRITIQEALMIANRKK